MLAAGARRPGRNRWGANPWRIAALLLALSAAAPAEPLNLTTADLPQKAHVETKVEELNAATDLDATAKATLLDLYRRTLSQLEDMRSYEDKAKELAEVLRKAPAETTAIREQLEANRNAEPRVQRGLGADVLAQRLSKVLADISVEEARIAELDKLIDETSQSPGKVRARITELKQQLTGIDETLRAQPPVGEPPATAQARRWQMATQRAALVAEGLALEQELLTQSARQDLAKARRDASAEQLRLLRAEQQLLEEQRTIQRSVEAEQALKAAARAESQAEGKHPLVRDLIADNSALTQSISELAARLEGFNTQLSELEAENRRILEDYRGAKQRIEAVGLSKALGQVLRDRRSQLPDLREQKRGIAARDTQMAEATLRQIRHREELRKLNDPRQYLAALLERDPSAADAEVREALLAAMDQRKRLLDQALAVEDDEIRQLGELNYAAEQVISSAETYADFLAERLLWVRSAPALGPQTLGRIPEALAWLLDPGAWRGLGQALLEHLVRTPLLWLGFGLVAALLARAAALRRAIRARAEPLRRVRTDHIRYTLQALGLTLIAAAPVPALLWLLGLAIQTAEPSSAQSTAFGSALSELSASLYLVMAFRALCMVGGVADRHFRWSTETLRRIRRALNWFVGLVFPLAVATLTLYNNEDSAQIGSLGRLLLIADMLGFAAVFVMLLHPTRGAISRYLAANTSGWLYRLRHLWLLLIVGIPLLLATLAVLGYVYTAGILFESLVHQTWLGLGILALHQVIVRWLILTRRRLALLAALERQAARRAHAEAERAENSAPSEVLQFDEPEPDLAALDEQTRRLITASLVMGAAVGVWLTWSSVLPAFSLFDRIALWHYQGVIEGKQELIPVTVADVGLVLLIGVAATIAARYLPALLEILLLQTASISAGARYTIKTLGRYLITAIAALLIFSSLGINWSQVQWLVAALGVGIGFGLQEIVANFISGLIILFERPVRVGDIVTIGDTTGVVTNIRIRATTIRNWDKQELLVPNKELITGRLLNWTLTDQQNRITIPVGVEYGSDTRKAMALLGEVAARHELVLADPAPLISFESFADNALALVLRCYLGSIDQRIAVTTALHQDIYETFSAHGIGIAFPQRDVHLTARQPLDVRFHRTARGAHSGTAGEAMPD